MYKDINSSEFETKMKEDNVVVLDVRTPMETSGGVIPGAMAIDLQSSNFGEQIQNLDKSKTYLVYCAGGVRSVSACKFMDMNSFSDTFNLMGGFGSWRGEVAQLS